MFPCQSAYAAAQKDFSLELTDCWSDIIPAVMTEEWKICRKGDPAILLQSFWDVLFNIDVELYFRYPGIIGRSSLHCGYNASTALSGNSTLLLNVNWPQVGGDS